MKIVLAKITYLDPSTGKQFVVNRGWPCRDEHDAELIVRYHGFKTGAIGADCVVEEVDDEEIKSI